MTITHTPTREGDPKWRAEVAETRFTQARRLLEELAHREQRYRWAHDTHGAGSLAAGQAWDQMRRAGFQARDYLRSLEDRERQAS